MEVKDNKFIKTSKANLKLITRMGIPLLSCLVIVGFVIHAARIYLSENHKITRVVNREYFAKKGVSTFFLILKNWKFVKYTENLISTFL